jgi:hypothetical protein
MYTFKDDIYCPHCKKLVYMTVVDINEVLHATCGYCGIKLMSKGWELDNKDMIDSTLTNTFQQEILCPKCKNDMKEYVTRFICRSCKYTYTKIFPPKVGENYEKE